MKPVAILVTLLLCTRGAGAQQTQPQAKPPAASPTPQTEVIGTPPPAPATSPSSSGSEGFLEPEQAQELLHKVWLAEYRINDLLTEVHPERWKISDLARNSFNQTLEALRAQLSALESWRSQLATRPDSTYAGYMTYSVMGAVVPRLDGVARSITQRENASLGAQFSQAGNQLFDLQQALQPYLTYLVRSQEQTLLATRNNLATCQNELGYAMRGRTRPATTMRNVLPEFKGRGRHNRGAAATGAGTPQKPETKFPKKN